MPGAYKFFGFQYVSMNVRPSVRMCVRTYVILLDSG